MAGMYPDDRIVEIFGEQVKYPGLDPDTNKFTDGDFFDPLKKPSYIPAETFNLILDNLENLISGMGLAPDNTNPEQLKNALRRGLAPVGEYHMLSYEPSVAELVRMRYLPLDYRIIKTALYEELCILKYVGDALNNTADFWYKCNEDGTRTINGLYMRVEDGRGMFYRGAGANAVFKGADNTPYDGNEIGTFVKDAIRNIIGSVQAAYAHVGGWTGAFYNNNHINNTNPGLTAVPVGIGFDASCAPDVIVAHENRPASTSALICISY